MGKYVPKLDKMSKFKEILNSQKNLISEESVFARSFAGDLFKASSWFFLNEEVEELLEEETVEKVESVSSEELNDSPSAPEDKTINEVVDQMVDYVHTKASEQVTDTVEIANAKVVVGKEKVGSSESRVVKELDSPREIQVDNNFKTSKIAFIGEYPKDFVKENPDADLLSKMIQAMKLEEGSWSRFFLEKNLEENDLEIQENSLYLQLLSSEIEIIVSLGAFATNMLMGKRERLSKIHGQLQKLTLEMSDQHKELSVFPVFHPDLLQINPNMKRSAWIDLQKVMEFLNK